MKPVDRDLGMDRGITRRDILHGVGALAAAGLIPAKLSTAQAATGSDNALPPYPPALTGLRGSHAGSFEVAHELAWQGRRDWGPVVVRDTHKKNQDTHKKTRTSTTMTWSSWAPASAAWQRRTST